MRTRRVSMIVLLLGLACAGLLAFYAASPRLYSALGFTPVELHADVQPASRASRIAQDRAARALASGSAALPNTPASLRGSDVDGELHVDASGRFVADPSALRFFEYFLAARGELDDAALRLRIMAEIERRLPASARPDAIRLLDDYLDYRDRADELPRIGEDPDDLHAAIDTLYAMRREVFGSERAETLFGEDEKARTHALERRLILADDALSEADKAARLKELDKDLPEAILRAREEAQKPIDLRERAERMRTEGASEQEVFAMREQALGREAALRLKDLDARRAAFQTKLSKVRAERDRILADRTKADKEAAIEALLAREFEEAELVRARALLR